MATLMQRMERLVFGATAEERVASFQHQIEQVVERRLELMCDRLLEGDDMPEPDENGYWTRTPAGVLYYHTDDPATEDGE